MCKKDLGFFVDSQLRLLSCRKGNYLSMLSNMAMVDCGDIVFVGNSALIVVRP